MVNWSVGCCRLFAVKLLLVSVAQISYTVGTKCLTFLGWRDGVKSVTFCIVL